MSALDLNAAMTAGLMVAAFVTAVVHGATGMAGGILLAAVLTHVVGIKNAIPLTTCALIISHSSRVWLHRHEIDWQSVRLVGLFAAPGILFGAWLFVGLSATTVALVMAAFLICSIPVKLWARRQNLQVSDVLLGLASSVWGVLAGNVIGPGFVLAPFLQGRRSQSLRGQSRTLTRTEFVGTLACIVLGMNCIKLLVFSGTALLTFDGLWLGVALGLATIPGNWLGKTVLLRLNDDSHQHLINVMTILLSAYFFYQAAS
ncbi:sulfite exporter TauE/SafE family protein [Arenicella chitinivorans]|nr:sulfite exporter TauE/SafE family protein [Arenicella chitinivorans]